MQIHRRDVLAGTILSSFAGVRAARAAETTLRFYSWQTDDGSNSIWWKAANAAFEAAHPGVKIDFIKIPRSNFADQLMVMFGADEFQLPGLVQSTLGPPARLAQRS